VIVTGTVELELFEFPLLLSPELPEPLPLFELLELCATELTVLTLPFTVSPEGSSTVTCSPTFASDCLLASRSTVTICRAEVVSRTAEADPPPLSPDWFGLLEGESPLPDDGLAPFPDPWLPFPDPWFPLPVPWLPL
jgi:hypothetical protein